MKYIKYGIWLIIILIVSISFLNKEALLRAYAKGFEIEITKDNHQYDYIVILGGNPLIRVNKAIELYQSDNTPKILITQPRDYLIDDLGGALQSEFMQMQLALKYKHIPFEIATNPNGATSTYDEARDIARFLQTKKAESILLITDKFHTKRAWKTFKRVFENENLSTQIYIIGANNPYFDETNWWKKEAGIRTYIVESGTWIFHFLNDIKLMNVEEH